jgi:hypothetical protein
LDYFQRFIQKPLARNRIGKNSSTISSAVYRLPQAAVLPPLHSYPLGNTRKLPLVYRKTIDGNTNPTTDFKRDISEYN